MHVDRSDVIRAARAFLGTPFRHQGRSAVGMDCVGLVIVVAQGLGLTNFDVRNYSRRPVGDELLEHFDREMVRIDIDRASPGDVLLFSERRFPCHCGILAERKQRRSFVHAYAKRRRVCEEFLAWDWPERIIGAYAFRQLEGKPWHS